MMTQYPSTTGHFRKLPRRQDMFARYWKFGIVHYLESLRPQLPVSQHAMESFIYSVYTSTSVLLEIVPVFAGIWMECLGDLARYLYGIEGTGEEKVHWGDVAREWYLRSIDVGQGIEGRLYHHLGIIHKGDDFQQLYYYSKRYPSGGRG
jgi:hypothetical protein